MFLQTTKTLLHQFVILLFRNTSNEIPTKLSTLLLLQVTFLDFQLIWLVENFKYKSAWLVSDIET